MIISSKKVSIIYGAPLVRSLLLFCCYMLVSAGQFKFKFKSPPVPGKIRSDERAAKPGVLHGARRGGVRRLRSLLPLRLFGSLSFVNGWVSIKSLLTKSCSFAKFLSKSCSFAKLLWFILITHSRIIFKLRWNCNLIIPGLGLVCAFCVLLLIPKDPTYCSTQKKETTSPGVRSSSKLSTVLVLPMIATMLINSIYGVLQVFISCTFMDTVL